MAAKFLAEDEEDTEAIQMELKGAFRLYDREGKIFKKRLRLHKYWD